jgi:UDP-N-acetylglucosamine 2-epimerase (non-hydrolysing)
MHITLIAGARPNFMKIAPIIRAMNDAIFGGTRLEYSLVHTGQHYDKAMSGNFFEQLGIPEPSANLECGGGSHAEQTSVIMVAFERYLMQRPTDWVVVVGDVTSTMACSIVAKKLGVNVAHVEGGIRSWDMSMPEEINRLVTDSITDVFFTTSEVANTNLRNSGVSEEKIVFVGNTMIDTLMHHRKDFLAPEVWDQAGLVRGEYLVMTLHRPSNVDNKEQLVGIFNAVDEVLGDRKVVFPVHPRTRKNMEQFGIYPKTVVMVNPLGYFEFNYLVENAKGVITDSGGITEETTVMGIPCITMRNSTERPETVDIGTNELIGTDPEKLKLALHQLLAGDWKHGSIPPMWDGNTANRIVNWFIQ